MSFTVLLNTATDGCPLNKISLVKLLPGKSGFHYKILKKERDVKMSHVKMNENNLPKIKHGWKQNTK